MRISAMDLNFFKGNVALEQGNVALEHECRILYMDAQGTEQHIITHGGFSHKHRRQQQL